MTNRAGAVGIATVPTRDLLRMGAIVLQGRFGLGGSQERASDSAGKI